MANAVPDLASARADGPEAVLVPTHVEGTRAHHSNAGFPNFFIVNDAVFCNFTRCAEVVAEWVSGCISYMREKDFNRIEAIPEAEIAWTEHADSLIEGMIFTKTDSWFMGTNVPGKKRTFLF